MNIIDIRSTVVAIFPIDAIDFKSLLCDPFLNWMQQNLHCKKVEIPSIQATIPFQFGYFQVDRKKIVIDRVIIEERRIVMTVGGASSEARKILDNIIEVIKVHETRHTIETLNPVIVVDETICIAKLDFPYKKLLTQSCGSDLSSLLIKQDNLVPEGFSILCQPVSIKYKVKYDGSNEVLKRFNINLNDKFLSIEAREGTDPNDCVFFINAPLASDQCISLIRDIEEQYRK